MSHGKWLSGMMPVIAKQLARSTGICPALTLVNNSKDCWLHIYRSRGVGDDVLPATHPIHKLFQEEEWKHGFVWVNPGVASPRDFQLVMIRLICRLWIDQKADGTICLGLSDGSGLSISLSLLVRGLIRMNKCVDLSTWAGCMDSLNPYGARTIVPCYPISHRGDRTIGQCPDGAYSRFSIRLAQDMSFTGQPSGGHCLGPSAKFKSMMLSSHLSSSLASSNHISVRDHFSECWPAYSHYQVLSIGVSYSSKLVSDADVWVQNSSFEGTCSKALIRGMKPWLSHYFEWADVANEEQRDLYW